MAYLTSVYTSTSNHIIYAEAAKDKDKDEDEDEYSESDIYLLVLSTAIRSWTANLWENRLNLILNGIETLDEVNLCYDTHPLTKHNMDVSSLITPLHFAYSTEEWPVLRFRVSLGSKELARSTCSRVNEEAVSIHWQWWSKEFLHRLHEQARLARSRWEMSSNLD